MPRKHRKHDKTGRSVDDYYWNLPFSMARSDAFRQLSGHGLKVLVELRCRYNGSNNGKLFLSYEEASRFLAISKSSVKRAFDELIHKGFIKLRLAGNWNGRKASEWIVTFLKQDGNPPTNEWALWKPKKPLVPTKKLEPRYPNGIPACFDGAT